MILELTCFFPVSNGADDAIRTLQSAGFDTSKASLVSGEEAKTALRSRLVSSRRLGAATGVAICGVFALFLSGLVFLPGGGSRGSYPLLVLLSLFAIFAFAGAAIGGYYGMAIKKDSVLIGLLISRERIDEAKRILRNTGARFLYTRPATSSESL